MPDISPTRTGDIHLKGYFQSYKYFDKANIPKLKSMYLENAKRKLSQYKDKQAHAVCLHVSRGDMVDIKYISPPPNTYFLNAMDLFSKQHNNTIFIMVGAEPEWIISQSEFQRKDVYIIKSGLAIDDLSLLAVCNAVVVSVGTFGWWGGFLNEHGKVVYNPLEFDMSHAISKKGVTLKDYFPASWIAQSIARGYPN